MDYKTHKEFFSDNKNERINADHFGQNMAIVTIEELYQHFKSRLLSEIKIEPETTPRAIGPEEFTLTLFDPSEKVENIPKSEKVPFQEIVNLYHAILPTLPKCHVLTSTRKGFIRQRWLDELPDLKEWEDYFRFISKSDYLMGKVESKDGRKPFVASLEWITRHGNYAKIIEKKYHG